MSEYSFVKVRRTDINEDLLLVYEAVPSYGRRVVMQLDKRDIANLLKEWQE